MRIGIATDHGGFELKQDLAARVRDAGHDVIDFGAYELKPDDDYPDFVIPLGQAVATGKVDRGVAVCGSGVGASVCANKIKGVRACLIEDHPNMTTTALGATWLKNVSEPVEIYSIAEHGASASSQVLDPVCRMFVDADAAPAHLPWNGHAWHFCSFECARTFTQDPDRYANPQRSGRDLAP